MSEGRREVDSVGMEVSKEIRDDIAIVGIGKCFQAKSLFVSSCPDLMIYQEQYST